MIDPVGERQHLNKLYTLKTHKATLHIFLRIIKYILNVPTNALEGYASNSQQSLISVGSKGKGSEMEQ